MVAARVESERAQWGTQTGFILATLGAAIGLGNIWRFSYVVGDNGGGAFLIVYLVTIAVIGVPVLLAELAAGRAAQREAAAAFRHLARRNPWHHVGLLGVIVSFVIFTYYVVIAGWALKYFATFATASYPAQQGAAMGYFSAFIAAPLEPVLWQAAMMAASLVIVIGGIKTGIERASKLLMPLLLLIVVGLALHSLTLPDAQRGLAFLIAPDWRALAEPRIYLAALGQAFFSLGLAMGVLTTYGSYMPQHHRLPTAGLIVALGDTLFAIVAALVIFPAVFSFGMNPSQGPGLAFVTLPEIFVRMSGGTLVGSAFFGLLVLAALTSCVALLEIPSAFVIERWNVSRRRAAILVSGTAFLLGIPSSLGFGAWSGVRIAGMPILDAVDFFASNVLLALSGLAIALFVGWHWRASEAIRAVGLHPDRSGRLWHFSVRYLAPGAILIIFLRSVGLI